MTTTLEHVLDHYCSPGKPGEEPGYAVLATGPWGVGKTHQVRQALKAVPSYWVSLFGLRSREEVHGALIASASENGAAVARIAEQAKSLGDCMSGAAALLSAAPAVASAMLERSVDYDHPIVFDDLERCAMPLPETLGVLNDYVERRGCRVIVIAHDEKLVEELRGRREKLFGRTVRVEPQTDQAFDEFLRRLGEGQGARLVEEHRSAVLAAFEASEAKSLRVLRHVVEDLARLLDALEDRHLAHPDLVGQLVRLFAALDVEVRDDRLGEKDLARRQEDNHYLRVGRDAEKGVKRPVTEAAERHRLTDLFDVLLTDDLLVAMLIHGRYDAGAIRAQLDRDPRLVSPEDEPVWRVLWLHWEYPEPVLDDAARRMQGEFEAHAFTDPGVMLHVFALRVRLARLGLGGVNGTLEEVGDTNIAYIDDLYAAGSLPPMPAGWTQGFGYRDSYDGLGYAVRGDEEDAQFERAYAHLERMMKKARERRLREHHGPELLRLVREDPFRFAEAVCETAETARHPVLATIDACVFVDQWLAGERKGWRQVRDGLETRYKSGVGGRLLDAEREWLRDVIDELHRRLEAAKGTWIEQAITAVAMPRRLMERL